MSGGACGPVCDVCLVSQITLLGSKRRSPYALAFLARFNLRGPRKATSCLRVARPPSTRTRPDTVRVPFHSSSSSRSSSSTYSEDVVTAALVGLDAAAAGSEVDLHASRTPLLARLDSDRSASRRGSTRPSAARPPVDSARSACLRPRTCRRYRSRCAAHFPRGNRRPWRVADHVNSASASPAAGTNSPLARSSWSATAGQAAYSWPNPRSSCPLLRLRVAVHAFARHHVARTTRGRAGAPRSSGAGSGARAPPSRSPARRARGVGTSRGR